MAKGLFVKQPWADLLLSGEKTWEIRGFNTKYRGPLFIIPSGTGQAYGIVNLIDTKPLTLENFSQYQDFHQVKHNNISYKNIWAWVMSTPKLFNDPIEIDLKKGAVIFLNLENQKLKTMKDLYILENM